jgi:hypothetical protein
MSHELFIGAWTVVSSEARSETGEVLRPFGDNPVGMIVYERSGRMSVQIMNPERVQFRSADRASCSGTEAKDALLHYDAYFGTYSVDEVQRVVTHHVVGSLLPNWIGAEQRRSYEFSGNRLILTSTPMQYGGRQIIGRITWERVPD